MLKAFHSFVFKRFALSVAIAALALAACVFSILRANFNESISDILPVSDQITEEQEDAMRHFGQTRTLYFSVSAENRGSLAENSDAFSEKLRTLPELKREFHKLADFDIASTLAAATAYAPYIFDENDIAKLEKHLEADAIDARFAKLKKEIVKFGAAPYGDILANDPLDIFSILSEKLKAHFPLESAGGAGSAMPISADGKSALIIAEFSFDSKDSKKSSELVAKIGSLIKEFESENAGAKIAYAGGYRISADNADMAKNDSRKCLLVSIVLMLAICLAAFRRKTFALLAMLPSALGTLFAFAFLGAVFKSVSSISIGFASIAIGVTMDYAIHYIFHAQSLRAKSAADFMASAQDLVRPTFIGAATTIIAFAIMFFAGSRGFAQLGLFGGVGVAVSAFLSLAILPPILARMKNDKPSRSVFDILADKILSFDCDKLLFAIAALLTLLAAIFVGRLGFDGRISSFSGLYDNTLKDAAAIRAAWPNAVNKSLALAVGKNFDDAVEINAQLAQKLAKEKDILNLDTAAPILPQKNLREANRKRWDDMLARHPSLEADIISAAKRQGFKPAIFANAIKQIGNPPNFETAFKGLYNTPIEPWLYSKIRGDGNGVYIANLMNFERDIDKKSFRTRIGGESSNVIFADNAMFENHISELARAWMLKFLAISLGLVFAYLIWAFKSVKRALFIIVPVLAGLFWTFGAMAFFGISITLINAIFVIFAVCIAEDYAVFIVEERLRGIKSGVLQSVSVSAFTTFAAFGALGLATHPVLKGLGISAAISIFAIYAANILITIPLSKKIKI